MAIGKKPVISTIDLETATPEVKEAIEKHVADGYTITNEKLTLLHNVPCFTALEVHSYAVDRELQKFISERAAFIFEYAISLETDCLVCSTYFHNKIVQYGIKEMDEFQLTEEEELLVEFAKQIANNRKNIPEELFTRLKARYNEEQIVVLTTMGVFMIANNYFNDILSVEAALPGLH